MNKKLANVVKQAMNKKAEESSKIELLEQNKEKAIKEAIAIVEEIKNNSENFGTKTVMPELINKLKEKDIEIAEIRNKLGEEYKK